MSDEHQDPSANTQAFRAFANQNEAGEAPRNNTPLLIGGGVAVLVVLIVVVVLLVL
jgi:hypothetical protein